MPAQCFECHEYGHISADCPTRLYASEMGDDRPIWCGQCDRETRLVYFVRGRTPAGEAIEAARRCASCHPRSTVLPPTYRKCKNCKHAIYAWDIRSECGSHQEVGKQIQPKKTEKAK